MAARAAFRTGLVVGDVLMAGHAACAVGTNLELVNVMARGALGMAFSYRDIGQSVQPRQRVDLMTAHAAGLGRYRSTVRFVTRHALPMPCGALGELFLVTACAGEHSRGLVHSPHVAATAARMAQIAAGLANLGHVASSAQSAFAELAQVEVVRLVAVGTRGLAGVKRALGLSFFVAV